MLSLSQDKKIVPATTMEATLPIQPVQNDTVQILTGPLQIPAAQSNNKLMSVKTNKIILPGETMELTTDMPDQTVLIEGWLPHHWPEPQLVSITQGKLEVTNNTQQPVLFDNKKAKSIKVTTTAHTDWTQPFLSALKQEPRNVSPLSDTETIDTIKIGDTT